jgi:SOS response regulatory protein OraA/RecX
VGLLKKIFRERKLSMDDQKQIESCVVKRLEELHLIDDVAFANMLFSKMINSKNPKGPLAIKAELARKGISRETIDLLEPKMITNHQTLRSIAYTRVVTYQKKDAKLARQRTLRYLIGRGFSYEDALWAIDSVTCCK